MICHRTPTVSLPLSLETIHPRAMENEIPTQNTRSASSSKRKRDYLVWTFGQDVFLIDAMVEQCKPGRKIPAGFNSEGWNEIERVMQGQFGREFTKEKLRNRLRSIKKQYMSMKKILGESGFGWDSALQRVSADDDVWNNHVKANPKASAYRGKTLLDYEKLALVFGDSVADVANGREGILSNGPHPPPILVEPLNHFMSYASSDDENEDEVSSKVPRMTKNTDEFVKAPHHQRSFGDSRESLAWFLDSLSQTIEKAVEKLKPIGPTQSEIVEAVDELNLERKVRHKALKLLRDKEAASQFLAQRNVDFRRNWLYDEMDATV
eukprot:TRINITY_DN3652_c0_g1_i5.p1 TRINITY_DN3652_c0_g1~~TRINITY_DN3652_c0_g1_i5.p1  ORF type:complete len:322 (+),score=61.08 TRINITY_DN3652_c0_g1_i5:102-1067(+)